MGGRFGRKVSHPRVWQAIEIGGHKEATICPDVLFRVEKDVHLLSDVDGHAGAVEPEDHL